MSSDALSFATAVVQSSVQARPVQPNALRAATAILLPVPSTLVPRLHWLQLHRPWSRLHTAGQSLTAHPPSTTLEALSRESLTRDVAKYCVLSRSVGEIAYSFNLTLHVNCENALCPDCRPLRVKHLYVALHRARRPGLQLPGMSC